MKYNAEIVKKHWSTTDCSASEKNFYCFPPIRTRSCQLIFNEVDATDKAWCEYWTIEKYLKERLPFEKCLSICCGFGEVERILAKLQTAKKIVGTDIAVGAVEEATRRARAENLENIEYYAADLNNEQLPQNEYDLIWANGALHHIADLDKVICRLYAAMQDGGYLVSNEYVGPRYQQIGTRQQELINAVKHLLPSELRGKPFFWEPHASSVTAKARRFFKRLREWKRSENIYDVLWKRLPVAYFLSTDPSECVNSNNIIPTLKKYFSDVEVKYFNGSILFYALDSTFYNNFDARNPSHRAILQLLFDIEDTLVASGEISQDNAHIICRKTTINKSTNHTQQ